MKCIFTPRQHNNHNNNNNQHNNKIDDNKIDNNKIQCFSFPILFQSFLVCHILRIVIGKMKVAIVKRFPMFALQFLWLVPFSVNAFSSSSSSRPSSLLLSSIGTFNNKHADKIRRHQYHYDKYSSSHLMARKEATFGMGCFWEPSEELLKVDGVIDTIVGYTGNPKADEEGSSSPPTYEKVCFSRDWVEGVRVIYDDEKVSYQELLDNFFLYQNPKLGGSRQYSSIIFPHDEEQKEIAVQYLEDKKSSSSSSTSSSTSTWLPEWTAIEDRSSFYRAEGYHQRYWQKQRPRFILIISLLAVATGILDPLIPASDTDLQATIASTANGATLAIGLYVILERFFDSKVVKL